DFLKAKLLSQAFDVLDIILDQIRSLWIPSRIAMPAHIDSHDVIVRSEVRRDVIERVGHSANAVEHDERLLVRCAPFEVMDAQSANGDESVGGLLCLESAEK